MMRRGVESVLGSLLVLQMVGCTAPYGERPVCLEANSHRCSLLTDYTFPTLATSEGDDPSRAWGGYVLHLDESPGLGLPSAPEVRVGMVQADFVGHSVGTTLDPRNGRGSDVALEGYGDRSGRVTWLHDGVPSGSYNVWWEGHVQESRYEMADGTVHSHHIIERDERLLPVRSTQPDGSLNYEIDWRRNGSGWRGRQTFGETAYDTRERIWEVDRDGLTTSKTLVHDDGTLEVWERVRIDGDGNYQNLWSRDGEYLRVADEAWTWDAKGRPKEMVESTTVVEYAYTYGYDETGRLNRFVREKYGEHIFSVTGQYDEQGLLTHWEAAFSRVDEHGQYRSGELWSWSGGWDADQQAVVGELVFEIGDGEARDPEPTVWTFHTQPWAAP